MLRGFCSSRCGSSALQKWSLTQKQQAKTCHFQKRLFCSESVPEEATQRTNPLGIQMLPGPLHQQLFKQKKEVPAECPEVEKSIEHLQELNLWGKEATTLPDPGLTLPRLHGANLDQHFRSIAKAQGQPYLELAEKLVRTNLHPMPSQWNLVEGWTRYDPVTGKAERVDCPDENALVLDVETCVREGQRPTLAVALSPQAWYSWVSKRLASDTESHDIIERDTTLDDLIPLEPEIRPESKRWQRNKLVVGHHVSYDRARIREQYFIKSPGTRFLDTLSLHVCVAGQASHQRGVWLSKKKKKLSKAAAETKDIPTARTSPHELWMEVSSPNSLAEVHWLHVRRGKKKVDKTQRDVFVKGSMQDIRSNFQNLMRYCAEDVRCTQEVLCKVLPQFLSRCPHPVTFAGMLEMGSAYLPLDSSWSEYTAKAEDAYEEIVKDMKKRLMLLANHACSHLHNSRYLKSPWICNLDWSTKKPRGRALKSKKDIAALLNRIKEYHRRNDAGEDEVDGGEEELLTSLLDPPTSKRPVYMAGFPEWYRSLCMKRTEPDWRPGPLKITAQTRVTPYLLRMKWKGHPLHHHSKLKWGYIISPNLPKGETPRFEDIIDQDLESADASHFEEPEEFTMEQVEDLMDTKLEQLSDDRAEKAEAGGKEAVSSTLRKKRVSQKQSESRKKKVAGAGEEGEKEGKEEWSPEVVPTPWGTTDDVVTLPNGDSYYFFKLPHKDGPGANCGNPLAKDYLSKVEDGTLTSGAGQLGHRILKVNAEISYWRSARSRILEQFVVGLKGSCTSSTSSVSDSRSLGGSHAIVPLIQVAGTVTRRAVEPTWLTASNAKASRVGSELKAMVRAPPGYHLVGADVDSQELWIAAVLGDMHFTGIHGSTGVGWMVLQGSKADGTDVHSNTARTVGISRDHAKILNYGRIYGAGKPFMELLLRKFNPALSSSEIRTKANTLYVATKGERMYKLNKQGEELAEEMEIPVRDGCVPDKDWKLILSAMGFYRAQEYLVKRMWVGGTESHLFNKLESIATSAIPRTPVLGCCISKALEPKYVANSYQPSKINWVVQSSAVDYLHLMLVCTQWLFRKFVIDGRFCISIHDEVRYLVKSEDRYRAALALQIANLFTRAMFAYQLKMHDLPQSVAFFSAVDVDTVLRKEPSMDCVTPSNPLGLEKGHGIPPGEALDIYQLLAKIGSSLSQERKV